MKKAKELSYMLRKITYIDMTIISCIVIVFFIIKNNIILFLLLGYIQAMINFYINSYTVNYVFYVKNVNNIFLLSLSYFFRIIFTSIIGLVLFVHNKFNIVPYILGYNIHYASIFIYSLKNKDERM